MKKYLIILGVIAVLIVVVIAGKSRNRVEANLLSDNAHVIFYEIEGQNTGQGFMEVSFQSESDEQLYINGLLNEPLIVETDSVVDDLQSVVVLASGDEIDLSQLSAPTNDSWIIQNRPVRVIKGYANRFSFDVPEGLDITAETLSMDIVLSSRQLSNSGALAKHSPKTYVASIEIITIDDEFGLNVPGAREDLKRGVGLSAKAYAQVSNHDFWADRGGDIPDLSGGPLDCFAIATTNNLISLVNEHKSDIELPEPVAMIAELKRDMNWDNGITNAKFLVGKAAFVERYKLPIKTTEIKRPSMDDIEDALSAGHAVEISTTMLRSKSGRPNTGHVLTGVGASADGDDQQIGVHDPATPEGFDALGIKQTGGDEPYLLVDYPMWDGIAIIDAIFVQEWTGTTAEETSSTTLEETKPATAIESPATETSLGTDGASLDTRPTIRDPIIETSFAHVAPGEYSEIYFSIATSPGYEIKVKLNGPAVEPPSNQAVTADKDGLAHVTYRIYQYGNYFGNVTIEGSGNTTDTFTIEVK